MKRKLDRRVVDELSDAGFVLIRSNRHAIFKRPSDGASITVAITPNTGTHHQLDWVRQDIRRLNRKASA